MLLWNKYNTVPFLLQQDSPVSHTQNSFYGVKNLCMIWLSCILALACQDQLANSAFDLIKMDIVSNFHENQADYVTCRKVKEVFYILT